jgi:hypothetical protein
MYTYDHVLLGGASMRRCGFALGEVGRLTCFSREKCVTKGGFAFLVLVLLCAKRSLNSFGSFISFTEDDGLCHVGLVVDIDDFDAGEINLEASIVTILTDAPP